MAYRVIMACQLHMPSFLLGAFTESPNLIQYSVFEVDMCSKTH